jgi:isochorismate synthase
MEIEKIAQLIQERCEGKLPATFQVDSIDFKQVIASLANYPFAYWSSKDQKREFLFIGIHESFQQWKDIEIHDDSDYIFGGQMFANDHEQTKDNTWSNFIQNSIFRSQILMTRSGRTYRVRVNSPTGLKLKDNLHPTSEKAFRITEQPVRKQWSVMVNKALNEIKEQQLSKVALGRKISLESKKDFQLDQILERIFHSKEHEYRLIWSLSDTEFFVSLSPERLFKIDGDIIEIDSLAGTIERGKTEQEDDHLGDQLLSSDKNIREHRFVTSQILKVITPYCDSVYMPSREKLLKLGHIQHIHTVIKGKIKRKFTFSEFLNALHPTPAVGGLPVDHAQELIHQLEPFERGLYAAPIGVVGQNHKEFLVGIRCAHFDHHKGHIYGGVGIVADSDVNQEWVETTNKMKNFTELLCQ